MRFLKFLYWVRVWFGVYIVISSVNEAHNLFESFVKLQDMAYFAGSIYNLFIAVLTMIGILIITVVYSTPEKEIVKKEETTNHLEVR